MFMSMKAQCMFMSMKAHMFMSMKAQCMFMSMKAHQIKNEEGTLLSILNENI